MANNNARIIEKDILSSVVSASAGSSAALDLFGSAGGCSKYSCHLIYDVQSFSAQVMASATDVKISTDPTNPNQFLKTAHGFTTGLMVQIATSNTLPSPFVALTNYFVIAVSANSFSLASSLANALAGTAIVITTTGTGNQTVTAVALAGASLVLRKSNNAVDWEDVQSATPITADGNTIVHIADVSYRYIKVDKALTSGSVACKALVLAIGDAV